ncbi:MAG TPA: FHA domain-containing protein [Planctomycetota bacterium]|nr:FHA domain-containing protein [Planctomycetota bacterium]
MLRISITDSTGERVFATDRNEILVGSRDGVDLRIADPAADPNHCILRSEGGRVRLLSLSSGGTAVAGRRVGEAMLAPGQEFAVGATVVRILAMEGTSRLVLEEPPAPAAPPPPTRAPPPPPRPPEPPPPPTPAAHDGDFAREVRETLARAPWYAVSLMLHLAFLLMMSLIQTAQPEIQRISHIAVEPPKEMEEPELAPDTPLSFEEAETGLLDELNIEEVPSEAVRSAPRTAEVADFDDLAHDAPLGTGDGRKPVVRLATPLSVTKTKGGDKPLNPSDLEGEQGRAADEVKRGLGGGLHDARQKLSKENIVVVRGAYDKIEDLLDDYEWPHTCVTRDELLLRGAPKARILFVNCNNRPSPALASKLGDLTKRLLQGGCWVVTSDWSVEPYLTEAFPSIVRIAGGGASQRHTTVEVAAVGEDRLLTGVFPRAGTSYWWLEDSSTMVAVSDKATLLVASDEMQSRYGSRVVAFKFPYGRGLVVHLVGHFYQKDGNLHGLVAMHRLINNIIIERVRADR